jgi:hypothetical protein
MIIMIFYWLVLFFFASLSGIAFQNTFGLSKTNFSFTLLYGLIYQTFFLSVSAFFFRINIEIFLVNSLIQLLFFYKYKTTFLAFLKSFFISFSVQQVYLFIGIIILVALKSAQLPTIFDNESYYIQTIKWLNEYGFVKGVANVHPFLAQFSFWHVLQSGFSFSFLPFQFNDVNGFVLLIGIYYFIEKHIKKGFNWSFFGIIFLIFYYQFIDSPSPDLPILVFSTIIFYEYIENYTDIKSVLLFIVFMIFIKVIIVPILLIAFIYLFKSQKNISHFSLISIVFGGIWIIKNIIITGFPLFPLTYLETNFDWKMSILVLTKLTQVTIDAGFSENLLNTENLSIIEKLKLWFQLDGLNAVFNKGVILLFVIIPFLKFFRINKNFKLLYFILLIQFFVLLITSPQYRFYLPIFILFSTVLVYEISTYFKFSFLKIIIIFSLFLCLINLFFDVKKIKSESNLQISQLFIPKTITKYKNVQFHQKVIENLKFYDANLPNLYETSNGNLPCVNEKLFYYYNYFPQQRTSDLKDGFYAKNINND